MTTTQALATTEQSQTPTMWATLVKRLTLATIAVAVLLGATLAATGTASAATTRCGDGRCAVYLSKQETRDLGNGRAPKLPGGLPWQINVSYTALVKGHQFFARQYANRGMCSAFLMSVRPWENQGYTGYRC
ncbi:hypothetical protein [Rhodococcus sp. Q]|uniref:hypothetical protein n=1 Tax=Rhodococcus sp. Q TaxID=2502252 RepID=UPI0010F5039A|nr:hypothetical protein [Rhodococcus sp. Q]